MDKIIVNGLDEVVYHETLDNGLNVYIYKKEGFNKKTAHFVTKYGSNNYEFVPVGKNKMKTFPKGIAHFLEHKLFESSDNENTFIKFEKYGAMVNAYTNHYETCYYFSCSNYFEECLNLLLDFVQNPYFTDENTEKEKGIIEQEIDMTNDKINYVVYVKQMENSLLNNPNRNTTIGDKRNIRKITKEDLYECYNTFYHPSNMTLVLSGDFDVEHVMNVIKENQGKKNFEKQGKINLPNYKEEEKVLKEYEHITKNVTSNRLSVCYKIIPKKEEKTSLYKLSLFISMFLDIKFGATTNYEKQLIDKKIIDSNFNYNSLIFDDVILLMFDADIIDKERFIEELEDYLKDSSYEKKIFELNKRAFLSSMVRSFDSPSFIAQRIYGDIIKYGKFMNDSYDVIKQYTFNEFKGQLEILNYDNKSVLYVTNKEE